MKNLKYFPCERNKYFYGKLLTVEDFESEQKYMNDKRRIINRFMHGCGVVCGLGVIPVSDDTVSLEPGMALDFAGREIIVDQPVTAKLSALEGFGAYSGEEDSSGYLYLCIEYAEEEKNPVYNAAGSSSGEQVQYNKVAEGYQIYLTGQEPEGETGGGNSYYEEHRTIYWGNGVRISQVFPKYVKSGSDFNFRLIVENMGQKLPVWFSYELELDCLFGDGKNRMTIVFDENTYKKSRHYEILVRLRAAAVKDTIGTAAVAGGTFRLSIDGNWMEDENTCAAVKTVSSSRIVCEDIVDIISRKYQEEAMQEISNNKYHQSIYLAKISLMKAGPVLVIDGVEQLPFQQFIYSDVLSAIRDRATSEELNDKLKKLQSGSNESGESKCMGDMSENVPQSAFGTAVVDLGIGGTVGQKFFSETISHSLGIGNVRILLGAAYDDREKSSILYGAGDIFEEEERSVWAELAARVDPADGTFVAGIRLLEPTTASRIKIHWMALRDREGQSGEEKSRGLFLDPDMIYLVLREDYYFEPVFTGTNDHRVKWSVKEEGGGTIDENGLYSAPNVPGIYQVAAQSIGYPELTASAFVVVRDI